MGNLILHSETGRRAGLSRSTNVPSLLRSLHVPKSEPTSTMGPKAAGKSKTGMKTESVVEQNTSNEEDLGRPPDSSSDEEGGHSADIKGTVFGSQQSTETIPEPKGTAAIARRGTKKSKVGNVFQTRAKSQKNISDSSSATNSPKRKSQEDPTMLGSDMMDEFGRAKTNNHKRARKGKAYSRSSQTSSGKISSSLKSTKPLPDVGSSPEKKNQFKAPAASRDLESSDDDKPSTFKTPAISRLSSPESSPDRPRYKNKVVLSPEKEAEEKRPAFKMYGLNMDDSFDGPDPDPDSSMSEKQEPAATQYTAFKHYGLGLDDSLLETAQAIIRTSDMVPKSVSTTAADEGENEDYVLTMTQRACCPMCNEPVNPAELRTVGRMNTRQQEKFCRGHRKKTAKEDWELRNYPEIDWANLDSRISKHHKFIRDLINGKDSHYRSIQAEKVIAGQDRTLMKMTSNLIPGYYGSRGLSMITNNVMKHFTELIQKRMMEDRLMSARGWTPYVQSVLVPEIAVLLIKEDMHVDIERAREILDESVGLGELLNEEIRDVVAKRVADSEDEDE